MSSKTVNILFKFHTLKDKIGNTIFVIRYKSGIVDIEEIESYINEIDRNYKNGRFKSIILLEQNSELTIAARKKLIEAKQIRKDYFISEAIVVSNFAQKILAEHYSIVNGKYYPIKVFNSQNEAFAWLNTKKFNFLFF